MDEERRELAALMARHRPMKPSADVSGTAFGYDDRNPIAQWLHPAPKQMATHDNAIWRQRAGMPDEASEHWATVEGSPWKRSKLMSALLAGADQINTPTGLVLSTFMGPAVGRIPKGVARAPAAPAKQQAQDSALARFLASDDRDEAWHQIIRAKLATNPERDPRLATVVSEQKSAGQDDPTFVARSPFGAVHATKGKDSVNVHTSFLDHKLPPGGGYGVPIYQRLVDEALARGLPVNSGSPLSTHSQKVYPALERRGYTVERNPEFSTDRYGWIKGEDHSPLFTVTGPKGQKEGPPSLPAEAPPEPKGEIIRKYGLGGLMAGGAAVAQGAASGDGPAYASAGRIPKGAIATAERPTTAAIKIGDKIYTGAHHGEAAAAAMDALGEAQFLKLYSTIPDAYQSAEGFVTSAGRYVTRPEAEKMLIDAGMIAPKAAKGTMETNRLDRLMRNTDAP